MLNIRYLYEINALTDLESVCAVNIDALATLEDGGRKDNLLAHCISQQANLSESCGNVKKAIELNKKVYKIRLGEQPQKKNQLCFTSNNLGYCYNTANDHRTALEEFERCLNWWKDFQKDQENPQACPPVLLKNKARCLVYLENWKEAERMIDTAMPLLRDEKPLNWAMLA
jgi:tetratricopeptide (TPR) repeat protein